MRTRIDPKTELVDYQGCHIDQHTEVWYYNYNFYQTSDRMALCDLLEEIFKDFYQPRVSFGKALKMMIDDTAFEAGQNHLTDAKRFPETFEDVKRGYIDDNLEIVDEPVD